MNETSKNRVRFGKAILVLTGLGTLCLSTTLTLSPAMAQGGAMKRPALVITSDPLPESLRQKIYRKPVRTREITRREVVTLNDEQPVIFETLVTQKVRNLRNDLRMVQNKVSGLSDSLAALQEDNQRKAASYYAAVATVNTQLQSGTTPGNPRLLKKLDKAKSSLDTLAGSVSALNDLSLKTAHIASEASFLLEETRAAYSLSGAVEEDHVMLAQTEDAINNTLIVLERILNNVSDDITRTTTYLSSERNNVRALALAVTNGDLYGKSLANRPFSSAGEFIPASLSGADMPAAAPVARQPAPLSGPRPLVKIRFDKSNVDYEQPVYLAVNEALERYPNARFDLVAVHPTSGNAAEVAIESTRARRNAEKVLRTLSEMGLSLERIDLSHQESAEAATNEVHLYIR